MILKGKIMLVTGSDAGDAQDEPSSDSPNNAYFVSAKKHPMWEFQSPIRITSWRDVNIESLGYDPRSSYVEKFWLPFLGPSTIFLARRITEILENEPYGTAIDLQELSIMLGLGPNITKHSSIQKTLNRLLVFELARIMPSKAVSVRLKLPPLPQRFISRLPQSLQEFHGKELQDGPENALAAIRTRARSLALALTKLGHDRMAIEKQLISWRFHPSVCYETLNWIETVSMPDKASSDQPNETSNDDLNIPRTQQ